MLEFTSYCCGPKVGYAIVPQVNTALQLGLMGLTTISPLITFDLTEVLYTFQYALSNLMQEVKPNIFCRIITGCTTVWSGMSYLFSKNAVRLVTQKTH